MLVHALITEATQRGASLVEIRSTVALPLPVPSMHEKVNMVLSLPDQVDCLWRQLSAKVRNQIRKAERSGLSVEFGGLEHLDDFYSVFAAHMRQLGSPVHARAFFSSLLEIFAESARVVLVRQGVMPIGGLIALAFKDTLVVPWAASLRQYFPLCPNMLLYWHTLRVACQEGFRRFEFGRSSRGSNTYRFKRQWGAVEVPLFWYTIPLDQSLPGGNRQHAPLKALFSRLWCRLPLGVTRCLGPSLRKYITL
jgi:FemAB-related protein (PEP-CTERM system-associated)